mmetsp:Transcript_22977/g.66537  ORF Transcript_22977/g.66537 Transcript_22977/m.66537 type:complete len:396 (+) Transcript_22977:233-1420(+)
MLREVGRLAVGASSLLVLAAVCLLLVLPSALPLPIAVAAVEAPRGAFEDEFAALPLRCLTKAPMPRLAAAPFGAVVAPSLAPIVELRCAIELHAVDRRLGGQATYSFMVATPLAVCFGPKLLCKGLAIEVFPCRRADGGHGRAELGALRHPGAVVLALATAACVGATPPPSVGAPRVHAAGVAEHAVVGPRSRGRGRHCLRCRQTCWRQTLVLEVGPRDHLALPVAHALPQLHACHSRTGAVLGHIQTHVRTPHPMDLHVVPWVGEFVRRGGIGALRQSHRCPVLNGVLVDGQAQTTIPKPPDLSVAIAIEDLLRVPVGALGRDDLRAGMRRRHAQAHALLPGQCDLALLEAQVHQLLLRARDVAPWGRRGRRRRETLRRPPLTRLPRCRRHRRP